MYDYIYKENLNLYKYTAICRGYSNHNAGDSKIIYIYIYVQRTEGRDCLLRFAFLVREIHTHNVFNWGHGKSGVRLRLVWSLIQVHSYDRSTPHHTTPTNMFKLNSHVKQWRWNRRAVRQICSWLTCRLYASTNLRIIRILQLSNWDPGGKPTGSVP